MAHATLYLKRIWNKRSWMSRECRYEKGRIPVNSLTLSMILQLILGLKERTFDEPWVLCRDGTLISASPVPNLWTRWWTKAIFNWTKLLKKKNQYQPAFSEPDLKSDLWCGSLSLIHLVMVCLSKWSLFNLAVSWRPFVLCRQTEKEVARQHQGMDRPGVRQVP